MKKSDDQKTDKGKIKIAQDFASNFLTKLKNGESYVLNNEAIDIIKNSLNAESQFISW